MARYFFHLRVGNELIEDEDGSDLSDPDQVRSQALRTGRELWANACKAGKELVAEAILVADEHGRSVMSMPLADALPKGLKRA